VVADKPIHGARIEMASVWLVRQPVLQHLVNPQGESVCRCDNGPLMTEFGSKPLIAVLKLGLFGA
jgi:hypothetical protein